MYVYNILKIGWHFFPFQYYQVDRSGTSYLWNNARLTDVRTEFLLLFYSCRALSIIIHENEDHLIANIFRRFGKTWNFGFSIKYILVGIWTGYRDKFSFIFYVFKLVLLVMHYCANFQVSFWNSMADG